MKNGNELLNRPPQAGTGLEVVVFVVAKAVAVVVVVLESEPESACRPAVESLGAPAVPAASLEDEV